MGINLFGDGSDPGVLGTGQMDVSQYRYHPKWTDFQDPNSGWIEGSLQNRMQGVDNRTAPQMNYVPIATPTMAQASNYGGAQISPMSQANASLQQGTNIDRGQDNADRGQSQAFVNQLQEAANGQGPSLASNQLKEGQDRAIQQQMAALGSQRGSSNASMGQRSAALNAAQTTQATNQQAADARIQEQFNARNQLGSALNAQRSSDQSMALNQAQLNAAAASQNAQLGTQVNLANSQAQNQAALQQAQLYQQAGLANMQANNQISLANQNWTNQTNTEQAQMVQQSNMQNLQAQLQQEGMNDQEINSLMQMYMGQSAADRDASISYDQMNADQSLGEMGVAQQAYEGAAQRRGGMAGATIGAIAGIGALAAMSDENEKQDVANAGDDSMHDFLQSYKQSLDQGGTPSASDQQLINYKEPTLGGSGSDPAGKSAPPKGTDAQAKGGISTNLNLGGSGGGGGNSFGSGFSSVFGSMMLAGAAGKAGAAGGGKGGFSMPMNFNISDEREKDQSAPKSNAGMNVQGLNQAAYRPQGETAMSPQASQQMQSMRFGGMRPQNFFPRGGMGAPAPSPGVPAPSPAPQMAPSGGGYHPQVSFSPHFAGMVQNAQNAPMPSPPMSVGRMGASMPVPSAPPSVSRMPVTLSSANAPVAASQQQAMFGVRPTAQAPGSLMGSFHYPNMSQAQQAAAGGLGAAALSDEEEKKSIERGNGELKSFLDHLGAHEYSYKHPDMPGAGYGRYVSPMAQELEKSKIGKTMVKEAPDGTKMVDYAKGFGAILAAQAMLNERLDKLEKKNGK